MKTKALVAILLLSGLALLIWPWRSAVLERERTTARLPDVPHRAPPVAVDERSESRPSTVVTSPDLVTQIAPGVAPETQERAQFNERARAFFARAPALSPTDRTTQARQLASELSRHEEAGGLSAGEALLMRVALIRETVSDPDRQAAQITALQERYRRDTQRRIAEFNARSDPAFELYKVRESEIVAEIMTMSTVPGGLSRDEYLRQRLQQEREQLLNSSP